MVRKKDFLIPCSFEARRPCLLDQFLFIPPKYEDHASFGDWDTGQIFPTEKKIYVELCSGNGEWILQNAREKKEIFWIAVEKKFDRARNIWIQMKKQALSNLFLIFGEAHTFLQHYMPEKSIETLFINFPDPWPKRRHAKNRLITSSFLEDMKRVLKKQGNCFLVTDSKDYLTSSLNQFYKNPFFAPIFPEPHFVTKWEGFGSSYFLRLWEERERTIFYAGFERCL